MKKDELLSLLGDVNTDISNRWENGVKHHPKSIELAEMIAEIDFHLCSDSFDLKFGGDGDNGENLLYILDIYFDWKDRTQT